MALIQAPSSIVMVRPWKFFSNPETARDNALQRVNAEMLKSEYRVQDVIDFSGLEWDNLFLEGTGAMILDNINRVAYTAKSKEF